MRSLLFHSTTLLMLALCWSAAPIPNTPTTNPRTITQSDWSQWYPVSCFSGIDFRYKKQSFYQSVNKQDYRVEFRNRYNQHVYFSYAIVNPSERSEIHRSRRTIDRTNIATNSTGGRTSKMLSSTNGIYVFVHEVRFGQNTGPYANCQ